MKIPASLAAMGSTIARSLAAVVARHLLTGIGAALVARGLVEQAAVDTIAGPLAEEAAGAVLIGAGVAWGAVRAHRQRPVPPSATPIAAPTTITKENES